VTPAHFTEDIGMSTFHIKDMTCGHCVRTITEAIEAVDETAKVSADVSRHLVVVEQSRVDVGTLQGAIAGAGYTPVLLQAAADAAPARNAGCCGCR
jgi:copper chaperone